MGDERLRVAVIGRTGRGDYGHAIDELFRELPGAVVVAAADDDAAGLAKAAERHELASTAAFADWRKMLAAAKPDVVAICMRHVDCHAEMAIAACGKSGTKLSLAFVNRHAGTYAAVRDLIEDGRIGRMLELRARGKEDKRGGGEDLWVLGCHVLDLMADLGGAPQWCQATVTAGGRPITKADAVAGPEGIGPIAGDAVAAMFGLANGPVGYFASLRDAGLKQPAFGLTIAGSSGAIHIRPDHVPQAWFREAPLWRTDKEFPWQPIGAGGLGEAVAADVDRAAERAAWGRRAAADLLDAIANDREPETGMYAGRTVVEMTAAVYASALSGERITWPLVNRGNPLAG